MVRREAIVGVMNGLAFALVMGVVAWFWFDGVSLAAEFSKRLDSEGGRIGIEGKIAQENVEEAARAAQQKADQVAAQAKSQVTRLPENVKTIGLIIGGSIVATIVFNSIGNALS